MALPGTASGTQGGVFCLTGGRGIWAWAPAGAPLLGGRRAGPRRTDGHHLRLSPDQYQVVPLRFSKDLDAHNPNTPEWREDVGLVVTRLLSKVRLGHQHLGVPPPTALGRSQDADLEAGAPEGAPQWEKGRPPRVAQGLPLIMLVTLPWASGVKRDLPAGSTWPGASGRQRGLLTVAEA